MAIRIPDNASSYHKKMIALLEKMNYDGFTIIQEANVKEICPTHLNPLDRFDFYLPDLSLVIEVHGEQHYNPVSFGGININNARQNFGRSTSRDVAKAFSAFNHGFIYIAFAYNEPFTEDNFYSKFQHAKDFQDSFSANNIKTKKKQSFFKYEKGVNSFFKS